MVKRVEVTYEGGHKEVLHYTTRYEEDEKGIVRFGFFEKRTEINMHRVLQIREL